mmetsp:Transcript_9107/g.22518  ORF Transcript_9107/g.22518 Transcript_9107/m.22518 type:complete len:263 (-) Transcript_9107:42-830(-)
MLYLRMPYLMLSWPPPRAAACPTVSSGPTSVPPVCFQSCTSPGARSACLPAMNFLSAATFIAFLQTRYGRFRTNAGFIPSSATSVTQQLTFSLEGSPAPEPEPAPAPAAGDGNGAAAAAAPSATFCLLVALGAAASEPLFWRRTSYLMRSWLPPSAAAPSVSSASVTGTGFASPATPPGGTFQSCTSPGASPACLPAMNFLSDATFIPFLHTRQGRSRRNARSIPSAAASTTTTSPARSDRLALRSSSASSRFESSSSLALT